MHIAILRAYLEVQYRARTIAGLQFADGISFAQMNWAAGHPRAASCV